MRKVTAPKPPSFPALVQQFFTEYLVAQRAVSPRTVACYRDALMLFLDFASGKRGKAPTAMRLADIQPDLILAFPDHLEHGRKNAVRSRNLRLTALRAFLKFAGRRDVASLHDIERALAVPMKRFERPMLGFLLDGGACVHLRGKGRKLRSIPLWDTTVVEVRAWLRLNPTLRGEAALLPNRDGQAMSRSNVAQRLDLAVNRAAGEQPSLLKKRVSPHTLRHYLQAPCTCGMYSTAQSRLRVTL